MLVLKQFEDQNAVVSFCFLHLSSLRLAAVSVSVGGGYPVPRGHRFPSEVLNAPNRIRSLK
jgi:hypothetical protein